MNILLLIVNTAASAIIVIYGVFSVINAMSHATGAGMRASWVALTTGALGVLLGPLFDKPTPSPYWTGVLVGLALYILFDRRRPQRRIFQ